MTNHIKKMLGITDENLEILSVEESLLKDKKTLLINARLSPEPKACRNCGSTVWDGEGKQIIVKNGTKASTIRFAPYNHVPTVMKLKKQKYVCKNCQSYSTADASFVKENCFIAEPVKLEIIDLLSKTISYTLISNLCSVSINTVIRTLRSLEVYLPKTKGDALLPEVLMVDEFRSHAPHEEKMSFICADGESGQLVEVLPNKRHDKLEKYFKNYSQKSLDNVKFLVTDMNATYFKLTKTCFKQAKVIIDRFHVVKHINSAFNEFRIREVKKLNQASHQKEAKKIKTNWKLLLKNRKNIDWYVFKSWRSYRATYSPLMTESMVIDQLLSYSDTLSETYNCFHNLLDYFRNKNQVAFFNYLKELPKTIDREFKRKVENLLAYEEGITNALIYPYSNGKLEAKNTHIKTLKRVFYGFKSFRNMRIRIFMINGLIQIK
ncbi:ISL3 family transposase [Vagococcus carniphilus]|uniref:ISL3 family transposase n=1 Tax=Vagococcus carniphilus TaxID=218144 RepID=UPI00288D2824|nr:ISL3 family transposase [Vagococcus carniphilus]MDT2813237.1 ISL3 family transposase [Vagococcus carniphilus]